MESLLIGEAKNDGWDWGGCGIGAEAKVFTWSELTEGIVLATYNGLDKGLTESGQESISSSNSLSWKVWILSILLKVSIRAGAAGARQILEGL